MSLVKGKKVRCALLFRESDARRIKYQPEMYLPEIGHVKTALVK